MIQRKNNRYITALGCLCLWISLTFSACTADITLDTDDAKPVLVIYGTVTNQLAYQSVQLSSSTGYFSHEKNRQISDAQVTLSAGNGTVYDLVEDQKHPGIYLTKKQMAGIPGESYRLKVIVDFNEDGKAETYEADATMTQQVVMDSVRMPKEEITGYHFYSINLYGQEPAGDNYYVCKYQVNDTLYSQISKMIVFNDLALDNQYITGQSISYMFDSKDKDKYKNDDDFNTMVFITENDKVTTYISNITKGYYNFLMQCQNGRQGENPFFGGPLSNISTNIKGGAIGYFTAYTTSISECVAGKK